MHAKSLHEFTDAELEIEFKKRKKDFLYSCVFVGVIAGVAIFSTVKNGFGILTLSPLLIAPIFAPSGKKFKDVKTELTSRGIKF